MDLTDKIEVGDKLVRMLAGTIPIDVVVENIYPEEGTFTVAGGWQFDIKTGVEIDHDLKWGPEYGVSGSYIKPF